MEQSERIEDAVKSLKSIIKSKETKLKSIDKDIINKINILITSVNEKKNSNTNSNEQIEEYKKLLISKYNEISKLNDINLSKENEIKRLNKLIEDLKSGSPHKKWKKNY